MCGIFGALSTYLTTAELDNVEVLAIVSLLRGRDSAGVIVSGHHLKHPKGKDKPETHYVKTLQNTSQLWESKAFNDLLKGDVYSIIGHTRSATVGHLTIENAHPHDCGNIIGVHNGTISQFGEWQDPKSDSRYLFEGLDKDGVSATLKKVGAGAYAIVFIDKKENTINFIRNDQRELWLMSTEDGQTTYYASEKKFLLVMAARARSYSKWKDPWLLKEGVLLSYDLGDTPSKFYVDEDIDVEPEKTSIVKAGMSAIGGWYTGKFDQWDDGQPYNRYPPITQRNGKWKDGKKYKSEVGPSYPPWDSYENKNVKTLYQYQGFDGQVMDCIEAVALMQCGCSWCNDVENTVDKVVWVSDKEYYCHRCATTDNFVRDYLLACERTSEGKLVTCINHKEEDYDV